MRESKKMIRQLNVELGTYDLEVRIWSAGLIESKTTE